MSLPSLAHLPLMPLARAATHAMQVYEEKARKGFSEAINRGLGRLAAQTSGVQHIASASLFTLLPSRMRLIPAAACYVHFRDHDHSLPPDVTIIYKSSIFYSFPQWLLRPAKPLGTVLPVSNGPPGSVPSGFRPWRFSFQMNHPDPSQVVPGASPVPVL